MDKLVWRQLMKAELYEESPRLELSWWIGYQEGHKSAT